MAGYSHLNRDGTPKVSMTRQAAEARVSADSDPHLISYPCQTCNGWHLGHQSGKRRLPPTEWSLTWDRIRTQLEIAS